MRQKRIQFENDLLNRETFAENLTKVIDNSQEFTDNKSLVIALDAQWGTGKTTFVTQWCKSIKKQFKECYIPVYYNAWENDDWEDAFTPILNYIIAEMSNKNLSGKLKLTATSVLKYVGKGAVKFLFDKFDDELFEQIKSIIEDIKDSEDCKEWFEDIGFNDVKSLIAKCDFVELKKHIRKEKLNEIIFKKNKNLNVLKEYQNYLKAKKTLKSLLTQMADKRKVIFFIDELDRCKPSFAIKTLEVLKHYFNIDNIVFVLSLDQKQLSYSIANLYGNGFDANGYLRRFFDLHFNLPTNYHDSYISYRVERLFTIVRCQSDGQDKEKFEGGLAITEIEFAKLIENIVEISKILNLSLRDINTISFNFKLFLVTVLESDGAIKVTHERYVIYFYLLALKYKSLENYNKLLYSKIQILHQTHDVRGATKFPLEFIGENNVIMGFVSSLTDGKNINKKLSERKSEVFFSGKEMKRNSNYAYVLEDDSKIMTIEKTPTEYIEDKMSLFSYNDN